MTNEQRLGATSLLLMLSIGTTGALAQIAPPPPPPKIETVIPNIWEPIRRPGVAALEREFDAAGLSIPADEVHLMLPRGAIPALFDPITEPVEAAAEWMGDPGRIVIIDSADLGVAAEDSDNHDRALGVPIRILNFHEAINVTVGGVPVVVTYSPLSDSIAVFDRRVPVTAGDGSTVDEVLDFEVTGALYNSNILLYDRNTRGLWHQLLGRSVGGMFAGTPLRSYPVRVLSTAAAAKAYSHLRVVSRETGHDREYDRDAYQAFLEGPDLLVPVRRVGTELPLKSPGLHIGRDDRAWFVPTESVTDNGGSLVVTIDEFEIMVTADDSGLRAVSETGRWPEGVQAMATLYFAWSACFPEGEIYVSSP